VPEILLPPTPILAVVIPAYRAESKIEKVIANLPAGIHFMVIVDDASPDGTADIVQRLQDSDPRIHLIRHEKNTGVGGAVMDGYDEALRLGAEIILKMDSDDQMDPGYIPQLIQPIVDGEADYTKGNRFLHAAELKSMPFVRKAGNIGMSFMAKLTAGHWHIFDPTNGFTAIHRDVIPLLDQRYIHSRYFFETSMLIELRLVRAVVRDVFIPARYGDEQSHLSILDSFFRFPLLFLRGFFHRWRMEYFVRDFTPVSLFLASGIPATLFGLIFGIVNWVLSARNQTPATTGTVMVATLPFIIGLQLIMQSLVMDIQSTPTSPIHHRSLRP
jgi:glycosyltransferase involved in cell wall biosynthesis